MANLLSGVISKAKEIAKKKAAESSAPKPAPQQTQAQTVTNSQPKQTASIFDNNSQSKETKSQSSDGSGISANQNSKKAKSETKDSQDIFLACNKAAEEKQQEEQKQEETVDIIPQALEEITDSTDLCQYFGYNSINELKDVVGETGIIDFQQLENGNYTKGELQDIAKELDEIIAKAEEKRLEKVKELEAQEQTAQETAEILAREEEAQRQAEIEAEIANTESLDEIKDVTLHDIASKAYNSGIPEEYAVYCAKEAIIEDLSRNLGTDVSLQPDENGNYIITYEEDGKQVQEYLYNALGASYDIYGSSILEKYKSNLRSNEPEKYALAKTMFDNPQSAEALLLQNYGGDGTKAAEDLQSAIDNLKVNNRGLFTNAQVSYDKEKGILVDTEDFGTVSFDYFLEMCKNSDSTNSTSANQNNFLSAIANSDIKYEISDKEDSLRTLTNLSTTIAEDIDGGTKIVQALKNAESGEDAYDVILTYCGFNKEVADTVYNYLLGDEESKQTNLKDGEKIKDNPFKGRAEATLMNKLYTNVGNKFVPNQELLNQFTETEAYDYAESEYTDEPILLKRPTKEYYTNLNGELCTRNWEYTKDGKRENIKLTFEENGSTREIEFYMGENSINEPIYYIKPANEEDKPIIETQDQFFKRLAVAQNYSILEATNSDLMQDDSDMSTEKIAQYYASLADYDKNISQTLSTISREFSSEGLADDARNWLSETFDVGISKDDILEEVAAETKHTLIMSYYINGQNDIAQAMVKEELERRLNSAENYQDIYDTLLGYYGDEKLALEIMNSSVVIPENDYLKQKEVEFKFENGQLMFTFNDDFGNRVSEVASDCSQRDFGFMKSDHEIKIEGTKYERNLNQDQAYKFLCNGGECTVENINAYNTAQQQFTDYNTAIATGNTFADCKSPEDAFYLITGKHTNDPNLTDSDIQKFNDFYNIDKSNFKFSGEMEVERHIGINYDKKNGFQLLYKDNQYHTEQITIVLPIQDTPELDYYSILPNDVYSAFCNKDAMDKYGLSSLNENYFAQQVSDYKQGKFEEYYDSNKEQVDSYIDSYANWAVGDEESLKHYAKVTGIKKEDLTPEKIAEYIKNNPEARYEESCKYMQYGYTTAKQNLYGESRLDGMTNQYCMDMATYSSNLSHIISMGCMIGSVLFPAAAPALMMGAKMAGYVDNAIDFINMVTNRQNYKDDDYLGWAKSTGFEWLTKKGYNFFGGIAGNSAENITKWLIDKTGGTSSFFANHALAQIFIKGSLEAVIETGVCVPWTMLIKSVQGGEYNLIDELKENFIYDFLPYARGWQDMLIGKGDTTLYGGDDKYYRWQNGENGEERIYVDPENPNKILGITSVLSNGVEKQLVKYVYDGEGDNQTVKIIEYGDDGKPKQMKVQENNGNKVTYYTVDEDENPISKTKTVIAEQNTDGSFKITTSEAGKPNLIETRDADGRLISTEQNGLTVAYDTKTGRRTSLTIEDKNGNTTEINYEYSWGRQYATVKTADGSEFPYKINDEGKAVIEIESENDEAKPIVVDENTILRLAEQGYSAEDIEKCILASAGIKIETEADKPSEGAKADGVFEDVKGDKIDNEATAQEKPEFNQEQYERAITDKYDETDAQKIASAGLSDEQYEKLSTIKEKYEGISTDDAISVAKADLSENQEKIFKELYESRSYFEMTADEMVKLVQLPSVESTSDAIGLSIYASTNNVPLSLVIDMHSKFNSEQLEIADDIIVKCGGNGFNVNIDQMSKLVEWYEATPDAKNNSKLVQNVIEKVEKYDVNPNSAVKLANYNLDGAEEQRYCDICSKYNLPICDSTLELAKTDISDEEMETVIDCHQMGIPISKAISLAQASEEERDAYIVNFTDLRNMKNNNGEPLFGVKVSQQTAERESQNNDKDVMEIDGKYYIMYSGALAYCAENGQNSEIFLDMVKDGTIPQRALFAMPEDGKTSEYIDEDISKICAAYYSGKPIEDVFVPKVTEEDIRAGKVQLGEGEEISLKTGDVVEINGHEKPCIINEDGSVTELNMSKETYLKLFPPVERYSTVQYGISNCWECSGFNATFRDSNTRHFILNMFSEDENGNITITYPNSGRSYTFEDGKLPDNTNTIYYSKGALAVQMLEWADGREIQAERRDKALANMSEEDMERYKSEGLMDENGNFAEDAYIDGNGNISRYKGNFPTMYEESRNFGRTSDFFKRIGMDCEFYYAESAGDYSSLPKDVQNNLSNPDYFKNNVVVIGTPPKDGAGAESDLDPAKGLISSHAYQVVPGEIAQDGTIKTYKLYNPHGTLEVELDADEFRQYAYTISVAAKNNGTADTKPTEESGATGESGKTAETGSATTVDDTEVRQTGASKNTDNRTQNNDKPQAGVDVSKAVDAVISRSKELYDEIDEDSIREMFNSIAQSSLNSNETSIKIVQRIMTDLCDYVETMGDANFDNVMKGISRLSEIVEFSNSNSHMIEHLFNHSDEGGLFSVEDSESVDKFFDTIAPYTGSMESDKFLEFINAIDSKVGDYDASDENLERIIDEIPEMLKEFSSDEYADALYEHYVNKVPMATLKEQLTALQNAKSVYAILEKNNISIGQDTIINQYSDVINELINRGYSVEEISQKFITGNAIVCINEATHGKLDSIFLADFIEGGGLELIASDYDTLHEYTTDNWLMFNDYTVNETGAIIPGEKYNSSEADYLSSLLQSQSLCRDMTLYRGEGFEVLNSYIMPDGQKLGEVLQQIASTGNVNQLKELENDLIGAQVTQPRFMSTAYEAESAQQFIEHETGIMWQIDAPQGSHCVLMDPFNTENSNEKEFLFDRNSRLTIGGIELKNGIVVIKAKLN